jgi:hypothetical protein
MSNVIFELFVEFILVLEGLVPEDYGFVYGKTKNLFKLSEAGQVHH